MTSRQKKGKGSSIDDVLGDLLGDDSDGLPAKPRSPAAGLGKPSGLQRTQSGKRNLLDDDFFSKLAEEAEKDGEGSDVSEADPKALLESIKDLDDMDADLFGSKRKSSSIRKQNETTATEDSKPEQKSKTNQTAEPEERKSSSAPAAPVRNYKKFSFLDDDDPLGDLLDDLDQERPKSVPSGKTEKQPSPSISAPQASSPLVPKKRDELTFDDDEDDPIDALGFNDTPARKGSGISPKKESTTPQRARTRLDEILGIGTPSRLLERPLTGHEKDKSQPEKAAERTPQNNSAGKGHSRI